MENRRIQLLTEIKQDNTQKIIKANCKLNFTHSKLLCQKLDDEFGGTAQCASR